MKRDTTKFSDLEPAQLENIRIHSRFLNPVIVVQRDDQAKIRIHTEAWRKFRGEDFRFKIDSLSHDWTFQDEIIYRISPDFPMHLSDRLEGIDLNNLDLSVVLKLTRNLGDFDVHVEADVLTLPDESSLSPQGSISGLKATLYPYQYRGVEWMLNRSKLAGGFILADEMGLGKTIQVIALMLCERPTPENPAIIIAPTTLLANWQTELLKFAPDLTHMIHRGPNRTGLSSELLKADIIITSYDTFVLDRAVMADVDWSWMILDEAQAVKNPETARRRSLVNIPRNYLVPMTGTPVETSLRDLWSLMDLTVPGLLGSCEQFEAEYGDAEEDATILSSVVSSLILRRRVEDVASDLPKRVDIDLCIDADESFYEQYEMQRNAIIEKYPIAGQLVAVNQMSMFCAHDAFVGREEGSTIEMTIRSIPEDRVVTPKLAVALELLREAFENDCKVLVFASFNGMNSLLTRATKDFPQAYWNAINGSTPARRRQDIVDEFTEYEGPGCLVLNPKAAGSGLNITAATIVIHYTLYWNPALDAQASARSHRRGQTQPVRIYRLFYPNTVEEVMLERARDRERLGDTALKDAERNRADFQKALAITGLKLS